MNDDEADCRHEDCSACGGPVTTTRRADVSSGLRTTLTGKRSRSRRTKTTGTFRTATD
jgi:hypothetical protein